MPNNESYYAGFFVRAVAYVIDFCIVFFMLLFIRLPISIIRLASPDLLIFRPMLFKYSIWAIILYLLKVLYFAILTYFQGATFGKKLFRITVCSGQKENLSFFNLIYRESIGRYLSGILNIGYFFIFANKEKKALHDILSDTIVVYDLNINTQSNNND